MNLSRGSCLYSTGVKLFLSLSSWLLCRADTITCLNSGSSLLGDFNIISNILCWISIFSQWTEDMNVNVATQNFTSTWLDDDNWTINTFMIGLHFINHKNWRTIYHIPPRHTSCLFPQYWMLTEWDINQV